MLTIRPARTDDEGFLINLTPRLADFPLPAWRTVDEIAHGDRQILRDALHGKMEGTAILVAEGTPGGERAGYVFATTKSDYFTGERHAHVEVLAVDPAAEGRGVARALMSAIERWARDSGLGFITLNVFDGNARARALYTRLGYAPETVHYRKALGPEAAASSSSDGVKVRVSRHFVSPASLVFDAWLDASRAGTWLFATPSGRMVEVAIDARVGGSFRLVDCRDGEGVAHIGEYVAIERPSRLVFVFGVPKYSSARDLVDIVIVPREGGCELTLTQTMTPGMEEWADRVEEGWRGILDGLAAELARCGAAAKAAGAWLSEFPGAVTVCDGAGVILEMNDRSVRTFESDGGRALVGTNLLDCHPEPSRGMVADLLAHPRVNAYTIEKRGVRKLIYQAPWYRDGAPAGLVELSLEIPEVMPHFIREA